MCNGSFKDMSQIRDVESLNYFKDNVAKGEKPEKLREEIFAGTRDNGRTPMCWTKGENAGFTSGTPWLKLIDESEKINVEVQDNDPFSVLNFYRDVIRLRHENPALVYGNFRLVNEKWKNVLAYYRVGEEGTFYIEINLTDKLQKKPLDTSCFKKVISNIGTSRNDALVPYEASIYKVN